MLTRVARSWLAGITGHEVLPRTMWQEILAMGLRRELSELEFDMDYSWLTLLERNSKLEILI